MSRVKKGHAIPAFYSKFGLAIQYFGLNLSESENVIHKGNRGEEREFSLATFLDELLPSDFKVCSGEVIDLKGKTSPALDIMIYDRSKNSPFYSKAREIIPAEAFLASFEVKTTLNASEARRCVEAAQKLKSLRPMNRALKDSGGNQSNQGYRFYHGIFAYKSNLTKENWAEKELVRFNNAENGNFNSVDFIYVLGRGLINVKGRSFIPEDDESGQALIAMYFGLYRFLMRENRRRMPAPFFNYATDLNKFWKKI